MTDLLLGSEVVLLPIERARLLVKLYEMKSPREWWAADRDLARLRGELQSIVRRIDEAA